MVKRTIENDDRLLSLSNAYSKMPLRIRAQVRQKERRAPGRKREVRDPREFGERAEGAVNNTGPSDMHSLDAWFAEIARTMKEKIPRRRIAQDPRIKELIKRRIALPRSHDGRARKELTQEIRKIIRTDTRNKKRGRQGSIRQTHQLGKDGQRATNKQAIRSASILHRRKTTTSDKEAIEAIANHIENIYKEPDRPIDIPPWNQNHGIEIGSLEKAVGLAVLSA